MITLSKLKKIFDQEFGAPFLDNERVTTRIRLKNDQLLLAIKIGRRDIEIDEEGDIVGAGTMLSEEKAETLKQ